MRQFASSGFRIWNLGLEAKIVYSFFGLFSLLAILSSLLLYEDIVGRRTATVSAYYAGEQSIAAPPAMGAASPATGSGPEIAMPDERGLAPSPLTVAVTYRKLLEVTHFHLFTVPVFLLIVAHLFMLTGLGARAKVIWIVSAWLSALLHLAAPWGIRYGGAALGFCYPISGALFFLTTTVFTAYPIWAMWFGAPAARPGGGASEERAGAGAGVSPFFGLVGGAAGFFFRRRQAEIFAHRPIQPRAGLGGFRPRAFVE